MLSASYTLGFPSAGDDANSHIVARSSLRHVHSSSYYHLVGVIVDPNDGYICSRQCHRGYGSFAGEGLASSHNVNGYICVDPGVDKVSPHVDE